MSQEITLGQFRAWLLRYAERIIEQEEYLTQLDAAIGDADHGANMRRGMEKVRERLQNSAEAPQDIGGLLRSVAMTLISAVGGAAGPLYGTFFLRASSSPNGGDKVNLAQLARMFRYGLEGLQQRGKAHLDDKTMLDAIQPAVEALEAAVAANQSPAVALASARQAARLGMEHTIEIVAHKGRASYLGERSIGHQDPGATSAYYLFETAAETLCTPQRSGENGHLARTTEKKPSNESA
ncbi:MAG: dihydroxyacetone kinase subunit L [Caldilineae bacterium]|nr:MAG: dihydroxyacetone kinase subunit L [Caldilineae bacterium]